MCLQIVLPILYDCRVASISNGLLFRQESKRQNWFSPIPTHELIRRRKHHAITEEGGVERDPA